MVTYSTMEESMKQFDFSYERGDLKELIRRSVRAAQYQGRSQDYTLGNDKLQITLFTYG